MMVINADAGTQNSVHHDTGLSPTYVNGHITQGLSQFSIIYRVLKAKLWGLPLQTYESLPQDLPIPEDDGGANHLKGMRFPEIGLQATNGSTVQVSKLHGRTVLYGYPKTGVPGVALPDNWDMIPGARGCTPEACAFRDHFAELREAGADAVFGFSTQTSDYQRELKERLHLPFEILSDVDLSLTRTLKLPAFEVDDETLVKRITLIIDDGMISHVFYPIFPPDGHAEDVLNWLRSNKQ